MSNKSLKDRMNWFKPEDKKMAEWLRSYAKRHDWVGSYSERTQEDKNKNKHQSDFEFAKNFIDNWTSKDSINDDDKYKVNLLKSAWRSYDNKAQTSTFSLSKNAQKALEYLSKRLQKPKTTVINELLTTTVDNIKRNSNRKHESNLLAPILEKEATGIELLIKELDNINEMRNKLDEMKEECERLQKENAELKSHEEHIDFLHIDK
ncbi:hypothetical protein [Vibrio fluvialis]|uniref:hypothetical protein n=1 Tax=Vibrio fluvialis TaxID=676 RepID=UPI00192CBA42|nr:hypothetical protein [Vibrio fluvialis]MBL4240463.1 hypothetical protein [Vibrio fluvialis]MBL4265516.1 hypothetical protein [Vibrio fluvialis]MBL4271755.1 hypothetical protein [Vibrio fluvialis]MBL4276100.1 hypothetical protein [Vibrio fluvialis]MBO1442055.1 hypothetical protein [Vibrio fluvialis]